jgi:hypothetical protein
MHSRPGGRRIKMAVKTAAGEETLGTLHNRVAKVMLNYVDTVDKAQEEYLKNESDDVGPMPELSAPMMAVMTKFLNDNKITCVPAESGTVSELANELADKRAARRQRRTGTGNVVAFPDAQTE